MPTQLDPITLNGAYGEGGGALLRTAVAMSSLTQQPLRLYGARGSLRKAGLTSEDLTFIDALGDSTRAEVEGAGLGSEEFLYRPKTLPRPLVNSYDVASHEKGRVPGNAQILLTGIVPILARAGGYSEVAVRAETHNEKTVGFDAFDRVTVPAMRRFGLYAFPRLVKPGFGFGSHGEVAIEVEPSALTAVEWAERGRLVGAGAVVSTGELGERVGDSAAASLREVARSRNLDLEIEVVPLSSTSKGATVTVWAEFEHGFGSGTAALGKEGTIEEVATLAFHRFTEWYDTSATVDAFLADQLLLVAVQAEGRTTMTVPLVTARLLTMAWVVRQFMPIHVTVLGREGEPGTVTVER
jgi:RNA 3'-terminal phosphate cyclase (ATP)